jgi:hypothetical protein
MAILQHQIIQRPVADVTTLKALDVTLYADGGIITVVTKGVYRYSPTSTKTPDDDKVVQPTVGSGRWLRMTDAEIDEHTENFDDLGDVSGFYSTANAIVTNNSTPDGLVESGATVDLSGNIVGNTLDLTTGLANHLDVNGHDIISSSNGNINIVPDGTGTVNGATPTEMGYLSGVSSAIQTQLNAKAPYFSGKQIYYVDENGSDTLNDGKSEQTPFKTLAKAEAEVVAQVPSPTNQFAIVCLSGSVFTEDIISRSYCHYYLPNATVNGKISVYQYSSLKLNTLLYSGTGIALEKNAGGNKAFGEIDQVQCTSTGVAVQNSVGEFEVNIDRIEALSGGGVLIATDATYTSGYINTIQATGGGNCVTVTAPSSTLTKFNLSFGRLYAPSGSAISLTANSTLNINAREIEASNAYTVNSSGAVLNLNVMKLSGSKTATSGTANVINVSGDSSFGGKVKATSFEGATGNAVTGFSDDITMAANSSTLGVTQRSVKTYISNFIAGLHWKEAVINEVDFTTAEPGSPSLGDRYINTVTGTSSGTAQSVTKDYIYEWNSIDWTELATEEGDACYVDAQVTFKVYNGSSWITLNSIQSFLGLNDTFSAYTVANGILANNATPNGVIQSTITADASGNLGSVSTLNTVTWPVAGGTTNYVLTLTGPTTAAWSSNPSGISNVVEDTTPQLGGDLDVNGYSFVSTANGNIDLIPDGTGVVKLGKNLDVNSKALSSVASINTVAWPAGGGNIGDVPTLTGPTTAAWQAAGGGGLPDQINTYYIGKNGNDSNDGLQLGEPKLTLTSANTAAGSTTSKFYITDIGTYTGDSFTTIDDSEYDCRGATFSNSNIILKAGVSFSCHKFLVTSGDGIEHYSSADSDPTYFNTDVVSASGSGRAILNEGNSGNIQYHRIGILLHSSSNSCINHQLGTTCFDIDEIRTSGTATGNIFNISGDANTRAYIKIKKLDASGLSSSTPAFNITWGTVYIECDEIIGVSSTYQLFSTSSNAAVHLNGKKITNALINNSLGNIKYYNLDTALLNFNPPKNLLVSGDFSKIPLWIKGVGLSSFSDATLVTPSFLILHNATADVQRNTSNQNELVLQLTSSGYLGGYEPLYNDEFSTYLTDLKAAGEKLSVGFYGRATGITSIKMDIIQWVPSTNNACLKDPITTWGSTPTLSSNATGAWSYVANSPTLTISGSNAVIKWEDISLSSFNILATRLGLLIRTAGSESSGDALIIKKIAKHMGYSFVGFEDRDEIKKTETRIACSYNNNIVIGTTGQMTSSIHSCFAYEVEPDMVHAAHFNYNTTLIAVPVVAEANAYNPFNGTAGQVRERDGTNGTIQAIDSLSQHSITILEEPNDGWSYNFKMHVVVHPKPYQ